jgi:hypothetical protein
MPHRGSIARASLEIERLGRPESLFGWLKMLCHLHNESTSIYLLLRAAPNEHLVGELSDLKLPEMSARLEEVRYYDRRFEQRSLLRPGRLNWLLWMKKPRTRPKLNAGKKSSMSKLRTYRRFICGRAFVMIE